MAKGTVKTNIEINFYWGITEEQVNTLLDTLNIDVDTIDVTDEEDEEFGEYKTFSIIATEEGTYTYSPAVMYLSNGDPGYPAEYDDTLEYDTDSLSDEINRFLKKNNIETEFDCYVSEPEEEEVDDYYEW